MKPMKLKLDEIKLDAGTQPRAEIDQALVDEYADLMLADVEFPPVEVVCDGTLFWLAHGFHRFHARRKVKDRTILAHVTKGTLSDAVWISLGANRANGKRLSQSDKERAITTALEKFPGKSDRIIANWIGASATTVGKYRASLESTVQMDSSQLREGQDGKMRPAHPNTPPAASDDVPMPHLSEPAQDEPPSAEASAPPSDDKGPTDCLGTPVTGKIAEAFARRDEFVKLMTAISQIKSQVTAACDAKDPLYASIRAAQFQADCNNLYRALRFARPHAVCPYCAGRGCRACLDRGWVGEGTYDSAPSDMKQPAKQMSA